MYIEIGSGIDGIFPYLRYGRRPGVTLKRWERDNVIELTETKPELETILALLYECDSRAVNYYHFTFSSSEKEREFVTPELMKEYCNDYFDILMTGYSKEEYMIHVEMHDSYRHVLVQKEKKTEEKELQPNYNKMKHAHAVLPAINLKTGTSLPITFNSQKQTRYLAAIQYILNTKHNLSHPKDQERPIIVKPQQYLDATKRANLEKIAISLQRHLSTISAETMLKALQFTTEDIPEKSYTMLCDILKVDEPKTATEEINKHLDSPLLIDELLSVLKLTKSDLKNKAHTLYDYISSLPLNKTLSDRDRYFVRKANRFALHDIFGDFPYPQNPLAMIAKNIQEEFPEQKIDYRFLPTLEETICVQKHGKIYGLSCREKAFEEKVFQKTFETNPFSFNLETAQKLVNEFKTQQLEVVEKRFKYSRSIGLQKRNDSISEMLSASKKTQHNSPTFGQTFFESLLQGNPTTLYEVVTKKVENEINEFANEYSIDIDIEKLKQLYRKERAIALVFYNPIAIYLEQNIPKKHPFKNYFSLQENINFFKKSPLANTAWETIISSIEKAEQSYCREIQRDKNIPIPIEWRDEKKTKQDDSDSWEIEH